jgi:hypothetical protein
MTSHRTRDQQQFPAIRLAFITVLPSPLATTLRSKKDAT